MKPETDLAREILEVAYSILLDEWQENRPIRMLTVTATGLADSEYLCEQLDFFGDVDTAKRDKADSEYTECKPVLDAVLIGQLNDILYHTDKDHSKQAFFQKMSKKHIPMYQLRYEVREISLCVICVVIKV